LNYLTRPRAAEYLTTKIGIAITPQGLADRASDGTGPHYAIVNGRAVYTEENLTRWIAEQAARPVVRRSQRTQAAA